MLHLRANILGCNNCGLKNCMELAWTKDSAGNLDGLVSAHLIEYLDIAYALF